MTMKITILKGSPRPNGNTNALTDVVEARLREDGASVKVFSLPDMDISPCTACRSCQQDWTKVSCRREDDFGIIADSVMGSDLILISTPIYSWYCTPPMKALLDRMVYAFNMYYGESRGPSLWKGKALALLTTCGYPPEKGADLFEEGMKRYCRHSQLSYAGMLCERHEGYDVPFMDEGKALRATGFADRLLNL